MLSVFLSVRNGILFAMLWAVTSLFAAEGQASFASLLAGGLSPVGLGGYHSSPARFAETSYGVSYYWMDDVEELSWNLSLEFGNDFYRVGAFVCYHSMDSLYRNSYSEISFAKTWARLSLGASYGLDMEWIPDDAFWARHRIKFGAGYVFRQVYLSGMLVGWAGETPTPALGIHWISDESIAAFAETDFQNLYVGADFRWNFFEISTSYRFPDFAVAVQLSFSFEKVGFSFLRGFQHNSLGWNGVHIYRMPKRKRQEFN